MDADLLSKSSRVPCFREGGLNLFVLYEGRDEVPERRHTKPKHDRENVRNTYLSISILCEDVLENLRNATPCFIVVAHNRGWSASMPSALFPDPKCLPTRPSMPACGVRKPFGFPQRGYSIQLQPRNVHKGEASPLLTAQARCIPSPTCCTRRAS